MDNPPSSQPSGNPPQPEALQARAEGGGAAAPAATSTPATAQAGKKRRSYRPSHRATFIGLAAVMGIILINAVIIGLVLKKQAKNSDLAAKGQVSISTADLNQLGINKSNLGNAGVQLTVAPDAQFKGKVAVSGDTTVGGQVTLNGKLTGTSASLTQLQAGNTSLSQLNVNGDGTLSTLNLRKDLAVAGITQLQGPVTLNQLLTVNNSANIVGNLAVGGTLSAKSFSFQNVIINGHLDTSGPTPSVGPGGPALGSNGSVAVSGNDASGNISINIGVGAAASGALVNLAFASAYSTVPHVVVSPVGFGATIYITNLTTSGFSVAISDGPLSPGGYHIDYIAEQ